jgi:hypothetical protein
VALPPGGRRRPRRPAGRTIGIDIAIPPKSAPQAISAFCVEHGRWTGKAAFDGNAAIVGSPKLKTSIQGEKNQSAVWAGVAAGEARAAEVVSGEVPTVSRKMSATGTYSAIVENREIRSRTADYVSPLLGRLEEAKDAVGLVVAINGELVAADVYGSPALFHQLARKLIESYAREALLASIRSRLRPRLLPGKRRSSSSFPSRGPRRRTRRSAPPSARRPGKLEGRGLRVHGAGRRPRIGAAPPQELRHEVASILLSAAVWALVVPQQPPTMRAPAAIQSRARSA